MSLEEVSYYSDLLPITVFLFTGIKSREIPLWVIFVYNIYSFINDSILLARSNRNLEVEDFLAAFTIIEYLVFIFILVYIIHSSLWKKVAVVLSAGFVVFCLINIINKQVTKFDSIQASIESLLIISYCVIYFFEQINKPQVTFIYSTYFFWIVVAMLVYLAATLFLYAFAANLSNELRKEMWPIQLISTTIKNIFFALAMIVYAKSGKVTIQSKTSIY